MYLGAFFAAAWPAAATAWRAVPASAEASVAALEDQLRRLQRQGQQGVGGGGGASANCMGPTGQPDAARNQATAAWHTTARTGARDRVQVAGRLRVRQDDGARGPRKRNRELYTGCGLPLSRRQLHVLVGGNRAGNAGRSRLLGSSVWQMYSRLVQSALPAARVHGSGDGASTSCANSQHLAHVGGAPLQQRNSQGSEMQVARRPLRPITATRHLPHGCRCYPYLIGTGKELPCRHGCRA